MKKLVFSSLLIMIWCILSLAQNHQTKLPESVFFISEKAEEVIDLYLKKDWTGAEKAVAGIAQHEEKVVQAFRHNQMPSSTADQFSYLIFQVQDLSKEKKNPILAALTANQITALLIDLQRFYATTMPLEIPRMDYLGREIVLLASVPNNFGLLERRIAELLETWDNLKPVIQAKQTPKAAEVASQVSQAITTLKSERTSSQFIKNGNHILDLIDKLEELYK
jgi:hypothetical protein